MDSDLGKLFIGGISWETNEDKLKDYFGQYGDVLQTVVMRDKSTGKPRGFGFVVFADPSILERVLQDTHTIDGRTVEAKKAMSREEQQTTVRYGNNTRNSGGGGGGGASSNVRTKKIFVGGLPPTLSDMEFRKYFEAFGTVTDVVVMYDPNTQRPRGFGFISFDSEDSVDSVVQKQFHDVGGKAVEVKRALPKDANPSITSNRSMGGGSYQSYSGSGANSNSYDNRVDGSRYMQPPTNGSGYNPYSSSGYSAPAYGYGTATNGAGYGAFGVYGGNTGAYGNPGGPGAGYAPPVAPRSSWSNQASSGYTSAGYGGNAGYEGSVGSWNTHGSGVPVSGHTGQSAGNAAGYGNPGYGLSEGPYGNQGGYGSVGGHGGGTLAGNPTAGEQGAGAGYNDGGGTAGYSNSWRSDSAQGGGYGAVQLTGYGGGYGGVQSRQGQQL